jgi:hypothetical protein
MKWMFAFAFAVGIVTLPASGAVDKLVPVTPAGGFKISFLNPEKSAVYVTGTWVIVGELIADPINLSKIRCIKEDRVCKEIWAYIYDNKQLDFDENEWTITNWTKNEITASDDSSACRSLTLTINFATNEVIKVTRNGGTVPEACRAAISIVKPLAKPTISRLVSPYDAMKADPRSSAFK